MTCRTALEQLRLKYAPKLPQALQDLSALHAIVKGNVYDLEAGSRASFPLTGNQARVLFEKGEKLSDHPSLRIGVVLSGGQAAGGHNVITGVFDALNKQFPGSKLIGFLNGPSGILSQEHIELTAESIQPYRNMGGFDMIGAGRTKIETPEQFAAAREAVKSLDLDGLVIIGGDDSNTNAALLAEDFKANGIKTRVVGVPKTIDGDLKNQWIETSFGFDTACKTYSETIGNMARDALSAKKYYYFIKLMGRSASHIALECALQTQPNLTLISEEIERDGKTLQQVTNLIADVICERAAKKKDYGVFLIPEGLLEFIPECKLMIQELNGHLVDGNDNSTKLSQLQAKEEKVSFVSTLLTPAAAQCYRTLPQEIQLQLIMDRDPHGNVQVSKIETESLFIELVKIELKQRKKQGSYTGKFSPQPHFCGYEGRSCFPSDFDANYCYALGQVAALLIGSGYTGYMACVQGLGAPIADWQIGGIPLVGMMHEEIRKGKKQHVIRKAVVDLQGPVFYEFMQHREDWILEDAYQYPGPIQFFGPPNLTDAITKTLSLEAQR